MTRRLISLLVLLVTAAMPALAQDVNPLVLASTAWTAAFARAAGAERVEVLAPYEMTHPPEYALRPSDLVRVANADLVVYAGYEVMVPRLVEAVDRSERLVQIGTTHAMETIEASVRLLADRLGTQAVAERNLAEIERFLDGWSAELARSLGDTPVLVHRMQLALARQLGMNVVDSFGPAPLSPQQLTTLASSGAALVIDNGHNPVADPLRGTLDGATSIIEWINFPGVADSRTLLDVLRINRAALRAAVR